VNDEQPNTENDGIKTPFSRLAKEFEVLNNAFKLQESALKDQKSRLDSQDKLILRILNDSELREPRYHGFTTRELAQRAFNQSTVQANWEGLENHPVIKNLFQEITDRRDEQEKRIENVLYRFEDTPTPREFIDKLGNSQIIREINNSIKKLGEDIEFLNITQNNDRAYTNKHDLFQRDRISDMEMATHALDFVLRERSETMDSAFLFLIGAFSVMGYELVAEGLRTIIKKPKEELTDNGTVQDSIPESEN